MPFGGKRSVFSVNKEVLKFATGLEAIESVVLQASAADTLPSATVGSNPGRTVYGLLAGTILTKIPGDSRNRYRKYTAASGEAVAGILGDNIEFFDKTDTSDEPADMLFHSCVFNKDKIIDFAAHESDVRAALPTCRFDTKAN